MIKIIKMTIENAVANHPDAMISTVSISKESAKTKYKSINAFCNRHGVCDFSLEIVFTNGISIKSSVTKEFLNGM